MKIFVGLGNPGKKYEHTRHNVGFLALDSLFKQANFHQAPKFKALLDKIQPHKEICLLLKPQTFMNDSGVSVQSLLNFYKIKPQDKVGQKIFPNLYIIHDDLDIIFGQYKIQFGKGPKIHHGLLSIYQHLGTDQFWHVRIGVDNRNGNRSMPGSNYVLSDFTKEELVKLSNLAIQIKEKLINDKKN